MRRFVYPFSAIVGQEEMKLALMIAAVAPGVCGVLLRGEKGSGKSTAARALAEILPEIEVIEGCLFGCRPQGPLCPSCTRKQKGQRLVRRSAPFVNLPLSITEDALFGAIDFEEAVRSGRRRLLPGLLARANHGVLYVDEVNLLADHLVAGLLSVAESGVNIVERESLSLIHPARFILIGSMNPEEGELSPQFLDRFGLCVTVTGEKNPDIRAEIIHRRLCFEKAPYSFRALYADEEARLKQKVLQAQRILPSVSLSRSIRSFVAELCRKNRVPGHRADLILQTAAVAHAALNGRLEVTYDDVLAVADMVLRHRRREAEARQKKDPQRDQKGRKKPPEEEPEKNEGQGKSPQVSQETPHRRERSEEGPKGSEAGLNGPSPPDDPQQVSENEGGDQIYEVEETFTVRPFFSRADHKRRRVRSGRRSATLNKHPRGRFVRAVIPQGRVRDLAVAATIRAADPYQALRGRDSGRLIIREEDLREKLRESRTGHLLFFCVDGSGSMGAEARMAETKGAIMSLLLSAYQRRDRVGLMVFRGKEAQMVLPPTNSVEIAARILEGLPVGGSTPLSAALLRLEEFLRQILRREPDLKVTVFLITDGRGNVSLTGEKPRQEVEALARRLAGGFPQVEFVIIDTETGLIKLQMAQRLATLLEARYFTPEALRAEEMVRIAKEIL